ncbi:MAG: hypothetical protein HS104_17345 [Polyangiaceae bacterium]|nr:hypothetical protein [Polyangiaceae bacterium]MCL4756156.1 hypothetical protein [Myxococcales bacterium]
MGALCARSTINASGVSDKATLGPLLSEALEIERRACEAERTILAAVEAKL